MLDALLYNIPFKNSLKEKRNKNLNYQLRRSGLSHDLFFLQKNIVCCSNAA